MRQKKKKVLLKNRIKNWKSGLQFQNSPREPAGVALHFDTASFQGASEMLFLRQWFEGSVRGSPVLHQTWSPTCKPELTPQFNVFNRQHFYLLAVPAVLSSYSTWFLVHLKQCFNSTFLPFPHLSSFVTVRMLLSHPVDLSELCTCK